MVKRSGGGKAFYHSPGAQIPEKHHLRINFEDGAQFTLTTQMWGAIELYPRGEEQNRQYLKDMRLTPLDGEFTFAYFDALIDEMLAGKKRSVKALLTQEQIIPGLGNAIAQDILFRARLNPRHLLIDLDSTQRRLLYDAILSTVNKVIGPGGRYDEFVSEIRSIWSFDRSEGIEAHYLELEPEDIHLEYPIL